MDWGTVFNVFGAIVIIMFIIGVLGSIVLWLADRSELAGMIAIMFFIALAFALFAGYADYRKDQKREEYQEIIDGIKRYPIDGGIYGEELPGEEHTS